MTRCTNRAGTVAADFPAPLVLRHNLFAHQRSFSRMGIPALSCWMSSGHRHSPKTRSFEATDCFRFQSVGYHRRSRSGQTRVAKKIFSSNHELVGLVRCEVAPPPSATHGYHRYGGCCHQEVSVPCSRWIYRLATIQLETSSTRF